MHLVGFTIEMLPVSSRLITMPYFVSYMSHFFQKLLKPHLTVCLVYRPILPVCYFYRQPPRKSRDVREANGGHL